MTIADCCNRNVVFASRETTVAEAANLMRHHHVGDVVVVDQIDGARTPVGIVTDRDIVVEVVAADVDPRRIRLGDLLVGELAIAQERDACRDVVRLMAAKGVRRMPVVNVAGALVGIVTVDDLLPDLATCLGELSQLAARGREREVRTRT